MNLFVELTKLLLPIAALLVTAAIGLGAKLLREKAKNEIFGRAVTTAEKVVKAAVLEAQQTVVDSLKERNGGKLTDDEKKWIKDKVLNSVKQRITTETAKELQSITADLEGYLSDLIEAQVYGNKALMPGK
ncbi:MAG TPA: hypothetical protein GXZ55_07205 [Natronincola sp.]|nr:hypothetical protein [Natronincola sp.]